MDREKIQEIFERLADDLEALVPELNPRPSGARYLVVDCPGCGERGKAYLYRPNPDHSEPRIRCNRQTNCAYSKPLLDYLIERDSQPFFEVLKDLAERAHMDIPRSSPEVEEKYRMARKEKEDLERYMEFFQETLWSEQGKDALQYLLDRGYSKEDIQAMGLGCFPGGGKTLSFQGKVLERGSRPEALSYAMKGSMDDYRIIFPYRGPDRGIQTFMGRLIREPRVKEEGKYRAMGEYTGVRAQGPFNLHAVRGETAIVVEGFMDALLTEARGISNVVALGGANLAEGQGDALRKRGVKNLILALDNDNPGGTESIIREALKEGTFSTFVCSFQGAKDPDELIRNKGAEAFLEAIKKAKTEGNGVKWLLSRIGEKEDLSTDLGKQEAFKKMTEVAEILSNPLDRQEAKNFIAEALRIDPWDLEPFLEKARERAQKEKLSRNLQRLAQEVQKEAPENPDKAIALLQGTLEIIERGQRTSLAEAFFPPFSMEDLVTKLQRAGEGLPTGYPALDEKARFPKGAVSLVAGRPGHGKTTFLLNLLRKQIERDPRKRYLFLTYEEDTHWLITKLLVSMANWNLGSNPDNLLGAYQAFIRGDFRPSGEDASHLQEIKKAWDQLRELLEDQKVIFAYRPGDIREMAQAIRGMRDKWGDELEAVFLDYMQIVPAPEDMTGSSSYQRVQGISALVRDTAVGTNLPIIAGAQLSRRALDKAGTKTFTLEQVLRPEFLREAGDLEQDANIILGLYNKTTGAQEESGVNNGDSIPPFSVSILKNRNGPCGGKPIGLSYFPKEWRIEAGGDIFDDVKPRR